jgi:hypothetical protein
MESLLSDTSRQLAGILFLALVTVETGGLYMLTIVRGRQDVTPFQEKFARAGHAHAGVLLVLALVCQPFADATHLSGPWGWIAQRGGRLGAADAGRLLPLLDGSGPHRTERLIALVLGGAALLAASLATLGVGLLET